MGVLVPEDFALGSLVNDSERRVVEALRDGPSDSWLVLPDVAIWSRDRDFQLDVVLIHPTFGIVDLEVKGHRVQVVGGIWRSGDVDLKPQPITQAKDNAYALRNLLRSEVPGLANLHVNYGVAFPYVTELVGHLPTEVDEAQGSPPPTSMTPRHPRTACAASLAGRADAHHRDHRGDRRHPPTRRRVHLGPSRPASILPCPARRALRHADPGARAARRQPAGRGHGPCWHRQDPPRHDLGQPGVRAERAGPPHLLQRAARRPDGRADGGRRGLAHRPVPPAGPHPGGHARARGPARRRPRVVDHHRRRPPPRPLARDRRPVRHDRGGRGPGLQPGVARPAVRPARPRGTPALPDPRRPGPGALRPRVPDPVPDDGWTHCELVSNCRNTRSIGTLLRRLLDGAPAPAAADGCARPLRGHRSRRRGERCRAGRARPARPRRGARSRRPGPPVVLQPPPRPARGRPRPGPLGRAEMPVSSARTSTG